jgi:hypothetical protein
MDNPLAYLSFVNFNIAEITLGNKIAKVKEKTMANKKIWLGMLVMVLAFGFSVTGCATRLGAFMVISTKSIDWSRTSEYTRSNQRVDGEDNIHLIIFIPTGRKITIEDAVDNALQKVPGAIALVDAVLRYKSFSIFFYAMRGYYVEGTVLIDPKLASYKEIYASLPST